MRMTWRQLLNLMVSAALVSTSVPVHAVQVEIRQDIRFRQMRSGHQVLGILKAGSIVDVPAASDQLQFNSDGSFNLHSTLQYIMNHPHPGDVAYKNIDGERMPLFKVKVVGKAAGSSYNATLGSTSMIAMDFLERRGKTYVNQGNGSTQVQTGEDTTAYSAGSFDDSADHQGGTADCPDGTCFKNSGPVSNDRLDQLAQLGSIAPSTPQSDDSDSSDGDTASGTPTGLQGLNIPGKPLCNRFIGKDGSYGEYGRMAIQDIRQHPAFASHSTPFTSICRNYLDFSPAEKEHFQVWVLASLSAHEAGGCRANARNPGAPHGAALGLLQMEESTYVRRGRPHPACDGSMADPSNNLQCGIAIMDRGLVSPNHSLYDPSISDNYWRDLITPGETTDLINSYEACGNPKTHYASVKRSSGRHSRRHHRRSRRR